MPAGKSPAPRPAPEAGEPLALPTAATLVGRHGITEAQALGVLVIAAMKAAYRDADGYAVEVLVLEEELQLRDPEADDAEEPPSTIALRMRQATRARLLDQATLAGAAVVAARGGTVPGSAAEALAHGLAPHEVPAFAAVGVVLADAGNDDAVDGHYAALVDALAQRDPSLPAAMAGTTEAIRWFAAERERQMVRLRAVARALTAA